MRLCIPIANPQGLASPIAEDPGEARYLHFFDLDQQAFEEVDLASRDVSDQAFDAVICTRIHPQVFRALRQRGVEVYLSDATNVQQAIDAFQTGEMLRIPDEALRAGGCGGARHQHDGCGCGGGAQTHACGGEAGGCCSGGDHDHHHEGGGCSGGGHDHHHAGGGCSGGGHGHHHEGGACHSAAGGDERHSGCGCAGRAAPEQVARAPRTDALRIAVTSQNRKTVTEHAGKCRKFWIYEIQAGQVVDKTLLELSLEQSLHEWQGAGTHPLQDVDVLVTASAGEGMKRRLAGWGIETVVTTGSEPDAVVMSYLETRAGSL